MPDQRYSRMARVNQVVREVIADALERIDDDRLVLITVTSVITSSDLREANVLLSSLSDEAAEALEEHRPGSRPPSDARFASSGRRSSRSRPILR